MILFLISILFYIGINDVICRCRRCNSYSVGW